MNFWLFKTEPAVFGLDDLRAAPGMTTVWDGVRNYEARNLLRDAVREGDLGVLYHSSCAEPAAVALLEVVRGGYPDPSAHDPEHPAHDPRSRPDRPVWYAVDVRLRTPFLRAVTRPAMREQPVLARSRLLRRGNRLSVLPLTPEEMSLILALGGLDPADVVRG